MTIVTYEMHPCLLEGSGGMPPKEFTFSQIALGQNFQTF